MWQPGTKLIREVSPELGVGIITAVDGRFIDVFFPATAATMRLSTDHGGLAPVELFPGDDVQIQGEGEVAKITSIQGRIALLDNGKRAEIQTLWPVFKPKTLVDKLAEGELDAHGELLHRLDGYKLLNYRRNVDVASLLGGRVELFAHQLDTAARAVARDEVRWLLADEVGLGKTVVACMIASSLVRQGRVEQALILAPDTLTVQWLGELYRKFHQVFVHIDEERVDSVAKDFGKRANPFEIHPLSILSLELLEKRPDLQLLLEKAMPDLVIVDEAHQVADSETADVILPLVARAKHALCLTATPFQSDADKGDEVFLKIAEALRLEIAEGGGTRQVSNVSAVTRDDIHALGKRVPNPVDIEEFSGPLEVQDPRVAWLVKAANEWKNEGKKALVFVENATRAQALNDVLTRELMGRVFMFHERMSTGARDIELAQFQLSKSPVLVSSGAGSEGRNFQFCDVLVHLDLPRDPMVLEQRIGRLDRIGRTEDISIVYFRKPDDEVVKNYESMRIFEEATMGAKRHAGWSFPDSHVREESEAVMRRIPADLDSLTQKFVLQAAERLGLDVVEKEGSAVYFFEYGAGVVVDAIPGMHEGTRFLGTFDRAEAVKSDLFDFYANGHQLVESLLAELEDSRMGRVSAVKLDKELRKRLRGVYLLLLEGKGVASPRMIPLADASGIPPKGLQREGERILAELSSASPLSGTQASMIFRKFESKLDGVEIDHDALVTCVLCVAMD